MIPTKRSFDSLPDKERRKVIGELEEVLKELPQAEIPPDEVIGGGIYARTIHIPANTTLVGEIHKFENMNYLVSGTITVATEGGVKKLTGPCIVVSPAGTKRAGHTETDVIWTSLHPTNRTETVDVRDDVLVTTYSELEYKE